MPRANDKEHQLEDARKLLNNLTVKETLTRVRIIEAKIMNREIDAREAQLELTTVGNILNANSIVFVKKLTVIEQAIVTSEETSKKLQEEITSLTKEVTQKKEAQLSVKRLLTAIIEETLKEKSGLPGAREAAIEAKDTLESQLRKAKERQGELNAQNIQSIASELENKNKEAKELYAKEKNLRKEEEEEEEEEEEVSAAEIKKFTGLSKNNAQMSEIYVKF